MTYARKIRNFYFGAPENFNFWGKRRARRSALKVQSTQSHEPLLKRMFNFSHRYLIGIKSRLLPMQYLSKNVLFFRHKNPLHFLLAQGMKRFLTNIFFIPLERGFLPFASCTGAFLR